MIRKFLVISICFLGISTLSSCRDRVEKETVVKEVPNDDADVKIKVEKKDEGILERTGKQVDKKVNKKVDEKINAIGDDN